MFTQGYRGFTNRGKKILISYVVSLILISGLDAAALYLISVGISDSNLPLGNIQAENKAYIYGLAILLFILKSLAALIVSYLALSRLVIEENRLSDSNLEKLETLPWLEKIKYTSSDFHNSVDRGPYNLVHAVVISVGTIFAELFTGIVIIAVIFILEPLTAITIFTYFGLVTFVQHRYLSRRSSSAGREVLKRTTSTYDLISGYVDLRKVLTVMPSKSFNNLIEQEHAMLAKARFMQLFVSNVPRYFLEIFLSMGLVVVGITAYITSGAAAAAASAALFAVAGFRLMPVFNRVQILVITVIGSIPLAKVALFDVREEGEKTFLTHGSSYETGNAEQCILELKNVSLRYSGKQKLALNSINIEFEVGKQYAIVGRSGSGKTSLVDLCLGVIAPTSGKIAWAIPAAERILAYVPQESVIADGTVAQNVSLEWEPSRINLDKVSKALSDASLQIREGIDISETMISKGILSGGQVQRLGIARALYRNPNFLVLDEATNSLDSLTEREIVKTLETLKGKMTTLVVAHRLSTVTNVDCVVFMEEGEIKGMGTFEELKVGNPKFASLVDAGMM